MERLGWVVEGVTSGIPSAGAALIIVGIGTACSVLMGVRSWLLALTTSVPIAIALLITSSQLTGSIGLEIPIVGHAAIALALTAGIAVVLGLAGGHVAAWPSFLRERDLGLAWIGAAIGALMALGVWLAGIGDFTIPPQANDDIWHGYLVERLTAMPSITAFSVAPTQVDAPTPIVFYQYGLHLAAAFMHDVTGISVAEALNGIWLVHIGVMMPLGVAALTSHLVPDHPWAAFWAGAFSPGIAIFPYATNGILPYTAALAMGPGMLALLVSYLRGNGGTSAVAVAAAAVGIFTTHPSGAVAIAVASALLSAEELVAHRRAPRVTLRRLGATAALALAWAGPWLLASQQRELGESGQAISFTLPDAIGMAVTLGSPWSAQQPMVAGLAAVGITATVLGRRGVGLSVSVIVFLVLFVSIAVGERWAAELTLAWHANWYRVLAMAGLLASPLAGLGTARLIDLARSRRPDSVRVALAATIAIVAVAVVGIGHGAGHGQSIVRAAWHDQELVTSSDVRLFETMARRLPENSKVLNSPRDGSGWMYALSNVVPIQPYVYGRSRSFVELLDGTGPYGESAPACRALANLGATHALVKGIRGDISDEEYDIGAFVVRHHPIFTQIIASEGAILYEIDNEALHDCVA
jgi:hypothetical protein